MRRFFAGASLAAMVIASSASAQETTAVIRGTVTAAGTPVANAQLTITNVPSGTVSRAVTDSSGTFTASGLRSGGPYKVEVASTSGNSTVTDIFTQVGQPFDLPIDVASGAAGGDIVVSASAIKRAGITSDGPQTTLSQVDISKVASVNRDIRDIERRSPFATIDLTNSRAVSFAGVNPRFNRFTINGAQVGDNFGLNSDASPTRRGPVPFDAIAQVSVSIAPFDIRQSNFQGGVIDTQLLSGTNEYHVNGFYSQSTSGLQGHQIGAIIVPNIHYKSETYGATVSGPIIKDKLFFMGSYERNTDPRPLSPGSTSQVPNLTDATVANIQSIAKSVYNYDTGGILPITKNIDEKFVIKLDANLSDRQKLSFSYINAYDATDILVNSGTSVTGNNTSAATNTSGPSISLASNDYKLTELLRTGIVQLNSDWTDNFSTEARFVYKSATKGQDPEQGRGFAQFKVCTAPTSGLAVGGTADTPTTCGAGVPAIYFGPDISRQTNALFSDTYDGSFLMRYQAGNHAFKALIEYVENRDIDDFLQYSAGAYYFDSIADFQNKNASQFDYQNGLNLDPSSTSAKFKYGTYTFGLQDDWAINNTLRVTYGARVDLDESYSAVKVNQNFVNRYGFSNGKSFGGLYSIQPRLSFDYKGISNLDIRGGGGIFAGGTPDIYFSNSYANTGALQNRISSVIRTTSVGGVTTGCAAPYNTPATAAICTAALNGVSGTTIPTSINSFLTTNTASLLTAPTASVSPRFKLPSYKRFTLSADYKFFGINFGADYLYSKTIESVTFTDLRSVQNGVLPDGRPRYTFHTTPGAGVQTADTNTDIQIGNTSLGRSHVAVVRFDKEFDWGLSLSGSYTYQDVKDVSNATSSVAGSLYNNQAVNDPNQAAYGISSDQTKWQFKYNVGYDHAFFRDYRTVVQLFGETRAGRPYSYTMNDLQAGRSAVFGTTGNSNHYLLYVPTSTTDARVSYDTAATQTALDNLINSTALKNFRGQVAPKNIARSRANTRIDLHVEQEIPTFVGKSRITLFGDIENMPNLLNHNWGGVTQVAFPQTATAVNVQCLAVATATGTAAVANTASNQVCTQYRYSAVQNPAEVTTTAVSLYLIRVGARFKF
ncbi:TonB-dependent receptor [Glacieibacterium megasporae]|uniref:TonB-dependent receptor n=1 Tax=Glacieibacterium megasporae TaxID=2835787 RepID=UPI001C1DD973|nr:carboxypeptidase-like regulatory domain-containing protein [Polymorphobacter megasporae]UAJ09229.1 carboxypeptidase-like regulatory domain-containing protein [Polymorphobacter megasporae]